MTGQARPSESRPGHRAVSFAPGDLEGLGSPPPGEAESAEGYPVRQQDLGSGRMGSRKRRGVRSLLQERPSEGARAQDG